MASETSEKPKKGNAVFSFRAEGFRKMTFRSPETQDRFVDTRPSGQAANSTTAQPSTNVAPTSTLRPGMRLGLIGRERGAAGGNTGAAANNNTNNNNKKYESM